MADVNPAAFPANGPSSAPGLSSANEPTSGITVATPVGPVVTPRSHQELSAADPAERSTYQVGGGAKTALSLGFLLLLPFFASLPMMLYQRISKGLWHDTAGLAVMGLGLTIIMALLLVNLLRALLSKVEIGETTVRLTLPTHLGAIPTVFYNTTTVAYDQIAAVELRREVYGNGLAPVLVRGARLKLKDGTTVLLGHMDEAEADATFPVPTIANQVARKAGLPVTETGSVYRRATKKAFGLKPSPAELVLIADGEIARLRRAHKRWMMGLAAGMVALLGLGIIHDVMTANVDTGERASDATQAAKQPTKPVPKR
jgi:hypothetical protein